MLLCCSHMPSSLTLMTNHQFINKSNTMGVISGAGADYPSVHPLLYLLFMLLNFFMCNVLFFCVLWFVSLSVFFCLSFFYLRLLISPLVSSNFFKGHWTSFILLLLILFIWQKTLVITEGGNQNRTIQRNWHYFTAYQNVYSFLIHRQYMTEPESFIP